MKFEHCKVCRNQAALYSIFVNSFLVFYKGVLGSLSGSASLVADSLHSSADVVASFVTMISLKVSARPPNERYSYGYGKIQFISSAFIGILLIVGSTFILIGAVKDIMNGSYEAPDRIALIGALVSVILNEMMFRYQHCVGTENNSPAIIADAWDNRADAYSSAAVLVGIMFAVFGFPIADAIGAVVVSLMVINIGVELNFEAIEGLTDASADVEDLQEIYNAVKKVDGIVGIFYLRARALGEALHVEINVEVDQDYKVYEGDVIVEAIRMKINQELDHVGGVEVFLSPVATPSSV